MTLLPERKRIPEITLAVRLRLAREAAGLEQQTIADELGISRATVSNYETGKTSPGKMGINAWAVTCDTDVDWLKTGVDPDNPDGGGVTDSQENSRKITVWLLANRRAPMEKMAA